MVYKPKVCVYGSCSSRTNVKTRCVNGAPGIYFVQFPSAKTQTEKCQKWIYACGRPGFTIENVKRSTYICSLHFLGFAGPTSENPDPIPLVDVYPDLVSIQSSLLSTQCLTKTSEARLKQGRIYNTNMVLSSAITHKIDPKLLTQSLSPPSGWLLELQGCTAIFSKMQDNYRFLQCSFRVNEKEIVPEMRIMDEHVPLPSDTPTELKTQGDIYSCLKRVNKYKCCPGNTDRELVFLYKNRTPNNKKMKSYYCEKFGAVFSQNCQRYITTTKKRCFACTMYRSSLRKLRYRSKRKLQNKSAMKLIKKSKKIVLRLEKNRCKGVMTGSLGKIFLERTKSKNQQ